MSTFTELLSDNPIDEMELVSVRALIAFTAAEQKISEDTIREVLKTKFNTPEITMLRRKDYDEAIRFLVDFKETLH